MKKKRIAKELNCVRAVFLFLTSEIRKVSTKLKTSVLAQLQ